MNKPSATRRTLRRLFDALLSAYGPQGWWPGNSQTEIIVGAILTQNTNWKNVEKAIVCLQAERMLDWATLHRASVAELARLIRPAGYYNLKAKRLKNFAAWLWSKCRGDLRRLKTLPLGQLRRELLSINGVGPETADAILLYALARPSFVVDAYTARVAARHGLIDRKAGYDELKSMFEGRLPGDAKLFNEFHALLVEVGKRHCRPRARCEGCPLRAFEHDENIV